MNVCLKTSIDPICSICDEVIDPVSKKILDCCKNIIHSSCLENHLKQGSFSCPFCRKEIKEISSNIQAIAAIQRVFQKQTHAEKGDRANRLESMRNPEEEESPSIKKQLDHLSMNILISEDSLAYKKLLWKEGIELISSPIHYSQRQKNAPRSIDSQNKLKASIDQAINHWICENLDLVENFIESPPPLISFTSLEKISEELNRLDIPNEEKIKAWEELIKNYQNNQVLDRFPKENLPFYDEPSEPVRKAAKT